MTVKHLQTIQRQQMTMAVNADPGVVHKFKTGFNECAGEVSRYIGRMDGVEPGVKQRLVSHLASCVNGLQQISPFTTNGNSLGSQNSSTNEDVNNNTASARLQMMTGLQLIPSRLPTGELALLLPNSQHLPFFPPPLDNQVSTTTESPKSTITSHSVDRSHNSAFTAVGKERFIRSPLPSPSSTTASSYGEDSCDQPYPSPSHLPEVTSTSEHPRNTNDLSFVNYNQKQQSNLGSQSLLQIAPQKFANFIDPQVQIPKFGSSTQMKAVHTPLTVITSNEMLREHPQRFIPTQSPPVVLKDPLDFSIKKDQFPISFSSTTFKRPYQDEDSDKPRIKTDLPPPLKMPKLFTQSQNPNIQLPGRRSLFEIQNHSPNLSTDSQTNQPLAERKSLFEILNQPSTSSDDVHQDMWRPW